MVFNFLAGESSIEFSQKSFALQLFAVAFNCRNSDTHTPVPPLQPLEMQ